MCSIFMTYSLIVPSGGKAAVMAVRKYNLSRDRQAKNFTVCESCGGHFGNGSEAATICGECTGDAKSREIAVRLLIAQDSPFYQIKFAASKTRRQYERMALRVTRLALLIRHGRVPVPNPLPMPRRKMHDDKVSERVAIGIYRVLGNGSRRRWDTNASRR